MKNDSVYHGVFVPPGAAARVIGAAVVTLLFNLFLFHRIGPVALAIAIIELTAFVPVAMCRHEFIRKHRIALLAITLFIYASLAIMVTVGNGFIGTIAFLGSLVSLVLLGHVLSGEAPFVESLSEFLLIPLRLVGPYVVGGFTALSFFHRTGTKKGTGWARSLLVGLIIGLPIAFVLTGMFSGADPIFAHAVSGILKQEFIRQLATRGFFSTVIFATLIPLVFLKREKTASPISFITGWSFEREMTVVMTLVALVVGAFLVVEWPYIFARVAAETNLSQFGVATYSEYVKKGFGELLWIAMVLYGLLWGGLLALRGRKTGQAVLLPLMQAIVLTETLVFVVSVFRRIALYVQFHGWTLVRVYGAVFLVWVTCMLLTLAARHVWRRRWVVSELVLGACLFLLLGTWNAEQFIVNYPPTVNNRVDYVYLARLSSDGVDGWVAAYDFARRTLLDESFAEKKLLDAENRREIYYAGDIIFHLKRVYGQLARVYGSPEEQTAAGVTSKSPDRLDILFSWNLSQQRAYVRLKKEIPYGQLKQLEVEYIKLDKKILAQPTREQGRELDFSYDAPFLEAL